MATHQYMHFSELFPQVGLKLYQSLMRFPRRIEISLNDFKMFNWGPILSKCSHLTVVRHILYQSSSTLFGISKTFRCQRLIEVQFLQNVLMWQAPFPSPAHLPKNTCNQCKNLPRQSLLGLFPILEINWDLSPLKQNSPVTLERILITCSLLFTLLGNCCPATSETNNMYLPGGFPS